MKPIEYETRDENDPVGGPACHTAEVFELELVRALTGLKERGDGNTANMLYVATMAISSAINIAAKLMTMPEDRNEADEWAHGPTSRTAILTACLLVARCTKPAKDAGMNFQFGPQHILAAILEAEKIIGHPNDSLYTPGMVRAARKQTPPVHFFDNSGENEDDDVSERRTLN